MAGRIRGALFRAEHYGICRSTVVREFLAAIVVVALWCGFLAPPAAAQWSAAELFPRPPVLTKASPHGLESLAGVLDTAPVARGLNRLRLQLPGGVMVELVRDGFDRRRDGDATWRGHVLDDEGSRVILTVKNGYMAGRIFHGLEEYEIRPGPGQKHVVERIDTSVPTTDEHSAPAIDYSYDPGPVYDPYISPPPLYGNNNPDNIQLLVVYTPQALAAAGGTPQIEVQIQSMVDEVNTAFIDSGMSARIALVRTEEVRYSDSGNITSDLNWVVTDLGVMSTRYFFGADLTSLLVYNGGQCAGAAFVMYNPGAGFRDYAASVTALGCGAGTLAHEIGHNLGFEHNPENSSRYGLRTATPFAFGHYVDGSFRTIMSYSTPCLLGCPAALRFSNPNINFLGQPTGIVDQRDNALTGEYTAPIVAQFADAVTGAVVNRRVIASAEDVEEMADGAVVPDRATLDLGNALGGVQAVGLRFQAVNIPPGMRIDSAYLEFEAASIESAATSVQVQAEAADNASPFTLAAFNVTSRGRTAAAVQWNLPPWATVAEKHYSPDISAVVQEVVDRPGWRENNSMALLLGGTGIRSALAYDGGPASAPLLHVEYSNPSGPASISAPAAKFGYACTGRTCTFTDQSTDSDGVVGTWMWYFGYPLSQSSIAQNPTVTFPSDGWYVVSLDIRDDQGWPGRIEQNIRIHGANVAPVATNNAYATDSNVTVTGNVLTDGVPDSDADADQPIVIANTSPLNGALTMAANGSFTYVPVPAGSGTESFDYTISDHNGGTASATVTIAVTAVPVGTPIATNNTYTTDEDFAIGGNVLTDGVPDSDPNGDPLTVTANSTPSNGVLVIAMNGAFTYTPNADFWGQDSFTYTVSDGTGNSATATVAIVVNAVNDAPRVTLGASCNGLNCAFNVSWTDVDGPAPYYGLYNFGDGASAATYGDAWHSYAADGTYQVTFEVTDAFGAKGADTQTVTLVNNPPMAYDKAYLTEANAFSGNLLTGSAGYGGQQLTYPSPDSDPDGDAISVIATTGALTGTVSSVQPDGSFYYTPASGFIGIDSFTYTVSDGHGRTATATVNITVNHLPVASFTDSCIGLLCSFTNTSSDADGPISVLSWHFANGVFSYEESPSFLQNPTHKYSAIGGGVYSVTLRVQDSLGATAETSKTLYLSNANPAATDNTYITSENVAVAGNFLIDGTPDYDPEGTGLKVTYVSNPTSGSVSFSSDGTFTYTPSANFAGVDSFTYIVYDEGGGPGAVSASATVTITVNGVNNAPVATDNAYTTAEDTATSGNVLTDGTADSDVDGDALTVTANTSPANGAVSMAVNGVFTYTPAANFNGSDSFAYTVSDGTATATATVTVTVTPANDAPVAAFSVNCAVLSCNFTDGSTDIEGAIASWAWSFGDGAVSGAMNPAHSYAADGNYTVSLTVTDLAGAVSSTTQTVVVSSAILVATDNSYTTKKDTAIIGNFLKDGIPDSSANGSILKIVGITGPSSGRVRFRQDGKFIYRPNTGFTGIDSFDYSISDGTGGSATATVTITVVGNLAPLATDNSYTTTQGKSISGNVISDGIPDSDGNGDVLVVVGKSGPSSGRISIGKNGGFYYFPSTGFTGTDSFDYTISDGHGGSDTATVMIAVNPG